VHTGTSFAVPAVVAVVAVLHAHFARTLARPLNCAEMKALLVDMCAHPGAHNARDGYGLLQRHWRYFSPAWLSDSLLHIVSEDVFDVLGKKKPKKQIAAAAAVEDELATACTKFGVSTGRPKYAQAGQPQELANGQSCDEYDDACISIRQGATLTEQALDLGFENVHHVGEEARTDLLDQARRVAAENGDWGYQFGDICTLQLMAMPANAVSFDPRPAHFGYAIVFLRCERDRRETIFTVLMGAANGDIAKEGDVTPHGKSGRASTSSVHTEKRIVRRLHHFLSFLRTAHFVVRDMHIHFFLERSMCPTCEPDVRRFFAVLEADGIFSCESARFSQNTSVKLK
jgi:hypothetical protein